MIVNIEYIYGKAAESAFIFFVLCETASGASEIFLLIYFDAY
mgnify:CR=1 FL=1